MPFSSSQGGCVESVCPVWIWSSDLPGLFQGLQQKQELGDAVVLDADNNTVTTEYDDLGDLPPEIVSF